MAIFYISGPITEPEPEQHATKGRGRSSAARKVFGA